MIKQTYKPIEPVNIGVNKDTINDFARKYNLEIERVYDILNKYKQRKVAFTAKGDYWNVTETGATLSVAHNGNIIYAVFSVANGVETQVVVGVKRDDTNVILEAEAPFDGYMLFLSDDSTRGVGDNLPEDVLPQMTEIANLAKESADKAERYADLIEGDFPYVTPQMFGAKADANYYNKANNKYYKTASFSAPARVLYNDKWYTDDTHTVEGTYYNFIDDTRYVNCTYLEEATDNTQAFQQALNSGKVVLVPEGNYQCGNLIVTKASTYFVGANRTKTVLCFAGSGTAITMDNRAFKSTLSNMSLVCDNTGNNNGVDVLNVNNVGNSSITVEKLSIKGFKGIAIKAGNTYQGAYFFNVRLFDINIHSCGVGIDMNCVDSVCENFWMDRCDKEGLIVKGANVVIANAKICMCNISARDSAGVLVQGNRCRLEGFDIQENCSTGLIVEGNNNSIFATLDGNGCINFDHTVQSDMKYAGAYVSGNDNTLVVNVCDTWLANQVRGIVEHYAAQGNKYYVTGKNKKDDCYNVVPQISFNESYKKLTKISVNGDLDEVTYTEFEPTYDTDGSLIIKKGQAYKFDAVADTLGIPYFSAGIRMKVPLNSIYGIVLRMGQLYVVNTGGMFGLAYGGKGSFINIWIPSVTNYQYYTFTSTLDKEGNHILSVGYGTDLNNMKWQKANLGAGEIDLSSSFRVGSPNVSSITDDNAVRISHLYYGKLVNSNDSLKMFDNFMYDNLVTKLQINNDFIYK